MDEWVVRAGIADAQRLMAGYVRHLGYPQQQIYGCSVQYEPGLSIDELAKAGRFPNGQISYAQRIDLESALLPLNFIMELRRTQGTGYHHTFMVLYDTARIVQTSLRQDVADALAAVFQRKRNPFPVPRP